VSESRARQGLGKSRGGFTTKIHTLCEGLGRNLASRITGGQAHDTKQLVPLLDDVAVPRLTPGVRCRKRPDHLCGDKAYGSRANRKALRGRGIPHAIPERDDVIKARARRGSRGGRPPKFDKQRYKTRNQVERLMNRRKQFRAVATRFDKLGVRYRATVCIADIFIWLRAKPDRKKPQ
jgi:transposase